MEKKKCNPPMPRYVWADYDAEYEDVGTAWAFYPSREEQQMNRPELKPFKFQLVPVVRKSSRRASR